MINKYKRPRPLRPVVRIKLNKGITVFKNIQIFSGSDLSDELILTLINVIDMIIDVI